MNLKFNGDKLVMHPREMRRDNEHIRWQASVISGGSFRYSWKKVK